MSKITVVVPSYNRRSLIGETIDAILAQTRRADGIVVVDDGSTDGTADYLRARYPDLRVISTENGGDLCARNVGTRAATTDYVAYCDSDDLWLPNHLETVGRTLDGDPGLVGVYANFRELQNGVPAAHTKFDRVPPGYWEMDTLTRLVAFQPYFPSCLIVRREALERLGGWDEGVGTGDDFATALRLARHVAPSFEATVMIRKHADNLSANYYTMGLRDANVLAYVLRTRPEFAAHRRMLEESMRVRRRAALGLAYDRRDYAAVRHVAGLVGYGHLPPKALAKTLISHAMGLRQALASVAGGSATRRSPVPPRPGAAS